MADVVHTDTDTSGSSAALGIILGILLVLALLVGAYFLFFRGPAATQPSNTIIEEQQQPAQPDTNIEQNQVVPPGGTDQPQQQPAQPQQPQQPAPTQP